MSLINWEGRRMWPHEGFWSTDQVDSTFREMLRSVFNGEGVLGLMGGARLMRVEEYVEDGTCVIRAELPGLDPEKDLDIEVSDGMLHISAEREERSEEDRPDGFRSEFHYGKVVRSLPLPEGATDTDVTASYRDGILEVRIPAPREVRAPEHRKIPVARGG